MSPGTCSELDSPSGMKEETVNITSSSPSSYRTSEFGRPSQLLPQFPASLGPITARWTECYCTDDAIVLTWMETITAQVECPENRIAPGKLSYDFSNMRVWQEDAPITSANIDTMHAHAPKMTSCSPPLGPSVPIFGRSSLPMSRLSPPNLNSECKLPSWPTSRFPAQLKIATGPVHSPNVVEQPAKMVKVMSHPMPTHQGGRSLW
ncbi:hypothetical protein V8F20_001268 [Naviculisporaceae sp. PSN 640]